MELKLSSTQVEVEVELELSLAIITSIVISILASVLLKLPYWGIPTWCIKPHNDKI